MANIQTLNEITQRAAAQPERRRALPLEYRLVFGVCFAVFLWAIAIERLVPRRFRTISDSDGSEPLLKEAAEAAHRCTSIAFQG